MADKKISALTSATTPLAGTEVLPIVQSNATVKVAVSDLTTGRAVSATQLTLTTGNLIVASGQGVDFSATPGTGTSELLADYEEGTWTPSDQSGAGLTFTVYNATYTKVGRLVQIQASITYPITASILDAQIGGLPFASANGTDNTSGICLVATNVNLNFTGLIARNNTKFFLETISGASISNVNMSSKYIKFFGWYIV